MCDGAQPSRGSGRVFLLAAGLAALAIASPVAAQTITRGPFIQNPAALSTTMTIEWWTNVAGNSTVEYGLTTGLGLTATVAQAPTCEVGAAGTCHAVPLIGLLPGTRYFYQLRTNGVIVQPVSPSIYFTTLKAQLDLSDLFFTVVGDWGQQSSGEQDVADLQDADDPQIIVTVGDNVYQNGTQTDWDNNLPYYQNPMRRIPFFPALGNHDVNSVGASNWATSAEIKLFLLPTNGSEPERYYSFDSGDVHFTVLDTNSCCGSTQTNWLKNDLANTTRKWKFVLLHHTPYSCASGFASIGSNTTVRNSWGPIFEENEVDVVFTGHDHSYERSQLMDEYLTDEFGNYQFGSDGLGTTYVMTGGGGASLDGAAQLDGSGNPIRQPLFGGTQQCYWLANGCPGGPNSWCSFSRYQYTAVNITNDTTMTLEAVDRFGTVFDTFAITKGVVPTTTTTTTATTTTTSTTSSTTTTTTSTTTTVPTLAPTTTTTTATTTTTVTTVTTTLTTVTTTSTTTTTATTTLATTTSTTTTTATTTTATTTSTTLGCLTDADLDLVCDADDNCPTVPNFDQTDADGDETGDACDPCTNGAAVVGPRVTIGRLTTPPGDDRLSFNGELTVSVPFDPPLDPTANGVRILVDDASGANVSDTTVPGGLYDGTSGWSASTTGWRYRSRTGVGIVKVVLKLSRTLPGRIKFAIKGRNGSWAVAPENIPVKGTLVLDTPTATSGQCGEATFPGPTPICAFKGSGATLRCR